MYSQDTRYAADVQHVVVYAHEVEVHDQYAIERRRNPRPLHAPPPRSIITTFTPASRRRLLRAMRRVRSDLLSAPTLVTLTYHSTWPEHPYAHLHTFLTYLRRNAPTTTYWMWRLEWQRRGAPHFHLLIWEDILDYWIPSPEGRRWIRDTWSTITGNADDRDHKLYGTNLVRLDSWSKATRYVAKYMAKPDREDARTDGMRRWGRSANLPTNPIARINISTDTYRTLRRITRHLLHAHGMKRHRARAVCAQQTYTIYANGNRIIEILDQLTPPWEGLDIELTDVRLPEVGAPTFPLY